MTQAWNLSQLANKVNTSGQLDISTGSSGVLPIANGGTNNNATPTAGGVVYGTGTAIATSTAGTSGYFLQSTGAGAPTWAALSAAGALNNIQYFTASGTYTATSGTSFVVVEVLGGGGGSNGANASSNVNGAGAGGYARKKITSSFSGVTVTIGSGGSAGSSGGGAGGTGGTSSFGALVSATGGANSGTFLGGLGSSGDVNFYGTNGGSATMGSGAAGIFGGGAATGRANQGGGAGGYSTGKGAAPGSAGGSGIVIVYEYK
jgi:hypothetical protein